LLAGDEHTLALDINGNVWAWGENEYYQLGNNTSGYQETPIKIEGLNKINKIACGNYNSFAIGEAGEIYSFGLNASGECGVGSYSQKTTIKMAKNMTDIIEIKAGRNYTLALKSTGEIFVTGSNIYGELGQDNMGIRRINKFTKIENIDHVVKISAGDMHALALREDGKVYTWGNNVYQNLGVGLSNTIINTPVEVQNLENIRYISAGKDYAMAINKELEIFEVGINKNGELGNGTKTNLTAYTKIDGIDSVFGVSCGNTYTVLVKADGTVWRSTETMDMEITKSKAKQKEQNG